jgi:predicted nucleic acid-binding protein
MTGWLIDTNVISELQRKSPSAKVVSFVSGLAMADMFISFITVVEIRFGIEKATDPLLRTRLENWLDQDIRRTFAGRILAADEDVLLICRLLMDDGRKRGVTFAQPDLIIAATALHHDLTIVTRNLSDFHLTPCRLVDPWR